MSKSFITQTPQDAIEMITHHIICPLNYTWILEDVAITASNLSCVSKSCHASLAIPLWTKLAGILIPKEMTIVPQFYLWKIIQDLGISKLLGDGTTHNMKETIDSHWRNSPKSTPLHPFQRFQIHRYNYPLCSFKRCPVPSLYEEWRQSVGKNPGYTPATAQSPVRQGFIYNKQYIAHMNEVRKYYRLDTVHVQQLEKIEIKVGRKHYTVSYRSRDVRWMARKVYGFRVKVRKVNKCKE